MANIRMSRINGEIQKAVADIINNKLNNPNLDGLIISVVSVNTASDLSMCKIGISVLSAEETKKLVVHELNKAKGYIRRELGSMVRLKTMPDIVFTLDNIYEKSQHIMELIDKVAKENKGE